MITSFLSGSEGRKDVLNLQISLAKLVTLPPKGCNKAVYLLAMAEQAYDLLQLSIERDHVLVTRAAVLILSRICEYDDSTLVVPALRKLSDTLSVGFSPGSAVEFNTAARMAHSLVAGTCMCNGSVIHSLLSTSMSAAS